MSTKITFHGKRTIIADDEARAAVSASPCTVEGTPHVLLAVMEGDLDAAVALPADEADELIAALDLALDREVIPLREELLAFASWLDGDDEGIVDAVDVDLYLATLDAVEEAEEEDVPAPVEGATVPPSLVDGARYRVLGGAMNSSGDPVGQLFEGDIVVMKDGVVDDDGDVFVYAPDLFRHVFVMPEYLTPATEETP